MIVEEVILIFKTFKISCI